MQKFHWKCTSVTDFLCEDSDGHSIRLFIRGEYLPQSDVIVFSVLEVHLTHDNVDNYVLKSDNEWWTVKKTLCRWCTHALSLETFALLSLSTQVRLQLHWACVCTLAQPEHVPIQTKAVQPNSASVTQASMLENIQPTFWWRGGNQEALIT